MIYVFKIKNVTVRFGGCFRSFFYGLLVGSDNPLWDYASEYSDEEDSTRGVSLHIEEIYHEDFSR